MNYMHSFLAQGILQQCYNTPRDTTSYNPEYNGWDSVDDMPRYTPHKPRPIISKPKSIDRKITIPIFKEN